MRILKTAIAALLAWIGEKARNASQFIGGEAVTPQPVCKYCIERHSEHEER